ncbi:MAG: nucleoside deaminase [Oscillospiraceae bacterium]|nr:nucleoside deaminase [Oscillospiraceae bacterium]
MANKKLVIEYEERSAGLADLKPYEAGILRRVIEICKEARESGNNPFGCLLADAAGNILMEQGNEEVSLNGDCTAHAEALLMRKASQVYTKDEMQKLTLYSCAEPCCMCAGAMYWGNLGRLVYIGRESELKKATGDDARNPTLNLPVRAVFASGQKDMEIVGPILELEPDFMKCHEGFWNPSNTNNG